jgi:AmmeMemoRadiSam system protein B/AmmeMemoRadiSam system protein A
MVRFKILIFTFLTAGRCPCRPPCPPRPCRPPFFPGPFLLTAVLLLFLTAPAPAAQVRESVIAGSWYPGNATTLKKQIEGFLAKVPLPAKDEDRLVALIAPHAGYVYSGPVAAHAYRQLKGRSFDTVVVVAPSHHAAFSGVSVYDRGGYRTPLGLVPLDTEFITALKAADSKIRYVPEAHEKEHSLEIQLPFLQTLMPGFRLVPLVMGQQDLSTCRRLAKVLAQCAEDKSVLLVASSDLSHYYPRAEARKLDEQAAARVAAFDPEGLNGDLARGKCEACGGGPMVAVMLAAEKLGADRSEVLKLGDSGDTSGDTSRVVGYMAAALWAEKEDPMSEEKDTKNDVLTAEEQRLLKQIARDAIASALEGRSYVVPGSLPDILESPCGAFVTLTRDHELRGCIGHITASAPLAHTVREVAMSAAFEDPRFSPVTGAEWEKIDLEVSVLTPLTRVENVEDITPGVHGLYIRKGMQTGLLLPQVATDYGWDRKTFLEQTCRKAGLRKNDWKEADTEIYWFRAQVF